MALAIPPSFHDVLGELVAAQDREWFRANRERIRTHCEQPLLAVLDAVADRLDAAGTGLPLDDPKLFRLARDVRFSSDKRPYKEHIAGTLPLAVAAEGMLAEQPVALYVHVGLAELYAGAGWYMLPKEALARFRERVLDDEEGPELERIVDRLVAAGHRLDGAGQLKRAPAGIDPEHPRIALLRWKGLVATFPLDGIGAELRPDFSDRLASHTIEAAPLVAWLADCVPRAPRR